MYGWYGTYGARDDKGKLPTSAEPDSVSYITYDDVLAESLAASAAFNKFDFGVDIDDDTVEPPTTAGSSSVDRVIVGITSAVVVMSLIVVMVIVLVVLIGRRREPKHKGLAITHIVL